CPYTGQVGRSAPQYGSDAYGYNDRRLCDATDQIGDSSVIHGARASASAPLARTARRGRGARTASRRRATPGARWSSRVRAAATPPQRRSGTAAARTRPAQQPRSRLASLRVFKVEQRLFVRGFDGAQSLRRELSHCLRRRHAELAARDEIRGALQRTADLFSRAEVRMQLIGDACERRSASE